MQMSTAGEVGLMLALMVELMVVELAAVPAGSC